MRRRMPECRPADRGASMPVVSGRAEVPRPPGCPSFRPPPPRPQGSSPVRSATRPALLLSTMKFSAAALSATLVAFASGAAAQLQIISPGGPNLWWGTFSKSTLMPMQALWLMLRCFQSPSQTMTSPGRAKPLPTRTSPSCEFRPQYVEVFMPTVH